MDKYIDVMDLINKGVGYSWCLYLTSISEINTLDKDLGDISQITDI